MRAATVCIVLVASLMAALLAGSPHARARVPGGAREATLPEHDDPLVAQLVQRIQAPRPQPRLHDQELMAERRLEWSLAQRAHGRGMTRAGVTLSTIGMLLWGLSFTVNVRSWRSQMRCEDTCTEECDCLSYEWYLLIFTYPLAGLTLGIGAPLLAAGITRGYLTAHPESAPKARRIGAGLGIGGLAVLLVGALSFLGLDYDDERKSEIVGIVGGNLTWLGVITSLTGLAIYAEARRAVGLQRDHGLNPGVNRKIAVDRGHRVQELARLQRGLPRAQFWSYALSF